MSWTYCLISLFIGINLPIVNFTLATVCDSSFYHGYCKERTVSVSGDFNIAVPISIHHPMEDKFCGAVSVSGVQTALAVEWIVSILNGNQSGSDSFIPGVKLGYTIFDDCGLASRTASFLTKTIHRSSLTAVEECIFTNNTDTSIAGVVTASSPLASLKALELSIPDVPVISVSYYSEDYLLQSGAFFGVGGIETEIKVMLTFMDLHNWNFVAVVYTEDTIGREYLSALIKQSAGSNNCYLHLSLNSNNVDNILSNLFIEQYNFAANESFGVLFFGLPKDAVVFLKAVNTSHYSLASKLLILLSSAAGTGIQVRETVKQLANDIFIISPYQILFDEFQSYFKSVADGHGNSQHNMWFSEYITSVCQFLKKSTCSSVDIYNAFIQEGPVDRVIVAIASMWNAVQKLHTMHCNGNPGPCTELHEHLKNLSPFLRNSSFTSETHSSLSGIFESQRKFGFIGSNILSKGHNSFYIIHLKGSRETTIGTFSNGAFQIASPKLVQESNCKPSTKCSRCIENEELQFGYVPGDIIILGLFSIHEVAYTTSNKESAVFKCGDYRTGSTAIITVSAFLESVKDLSITTGINFGAVALDDCYNELNISDLILDLFSKRRVLSDPYTKQAIDFTKVIAVVGALSSGVTQRIADILTSLHIPMVSYGASATTLDNRIRYPYFLRTVPSDTLQIEGIVKLLLKLNFKYTGALYIDDAYGASGIAGVTSEARSNGICVFKQSSVTEDTSASEFKDILKENYKNQVNVVVMFTIDTIVQKILNSLVHGDTSDDVLSKYSPIFVSSEAWGTGPNLANKESAGALIFTTDIGRNISETFNIYLQSLTASNKTENPWLYRFWEEHLKCYIPRSFEKIYSNRCNMDSKLNTETVKNLAFDQRNIHTKIAVSAIAHAYKKNCSSGLCLKRSKENVGNWTKYIRDVVIPLSDGTTFRPFKNDGNGNLGFIIYNIQKLSNSYLYVKVGAYDGTLTLQTEELKFYDYLGRERQKPTIPCNTTQHCIDFFCKTSTSPTETSTYPVVSADDSSSDILAIVLGTLAGLLLLVVILLTILVFKALRTKDTIKNLNHSNLSMEHLSAIVPHSVHHRSNRSLNGIYNEPHSSQGSLNDLRSTNVNKGYHSDNDLVHHQLSTSSGIVAETGSESAGSRIVYSDMAQTNSQLVESNKYLSLESSDGSNSTLKSLTRRVLQTQANSYVPSNEPTKNSNLTYLSAKDLEMVDEEESSAPQENDFNMDAAVSGKIETDSPLSAHFTPNDQKNILLPPAYPANGHISVTQRPHTLPGINPILLSPLDLHNGNLRNKTELPAASPEINLYTNDMYLMPVADSLPTYQQHLQQQQKQQLQNKRVQQNGKCVTPTVYTNVNVPTSYHKQNGAIPSTLFSSPGNKCFNSINSASPSSSFGSQSPSILSLSSAQKDELLKKLLHENPGYFHNPCNYNPTSPGSSFQSTQSNNSFSPAQKDVDKLKYDINLSTVSPVSTDNLHLNGIIEMDDREEVMI